MIQRHEDVPWQSSLVTLSQRNLSQPSRPWLPLTIIIALVMITLACTMGGPTVRSKPQRIRIITHLPTLTPTALAVAVSTPTLISPSQAAPGPMESAPPTVALATEAPSGNDPVASPEDQNSAGAVLAALVNLNVRTGPSVDYPIVGKLAQGQSAQIIGKSPEGTWWQIVYPPGSGSLAWVSADSQFSAANKVEAVEIAQLPPPPPPTATPTPLPPPQPTPIPAQPNGPADPSTPTPLPSGTPNAGPTVTPVLSLSGWAFTEVNIFPNQDEGGLVLYGNLINNTGSPQELLHINGTFYDEQGQVIAAADNTDAYWPAYVVPPNGGMPFELYVDDIDSAARFDLSAEADPSSDIPHQDFNFSNVNQKNEDEAYCVEGELTTNDHFEQYLIIAMILYDSHGNVVNFGDYGEVGSNMSGDDNLDFEICIDPPKHEVARYELRAWGS